MITTLDRSCCAVSRFLLSILSFVVVSNSARSQSDALKLPDSNGGPGSVFALPIDLEGSSPITAIQLDVLYTATHVTLGTPFTASETTNHQASSQDLSTGAKRVVIYSPTNSLLPKDAVLDLPMVMLDGCPVGGSTIRVQNIWLTKADGTRVQGSARYGPVTQWRLNNFSLNELDDANLVGDDRDADHDGVSNLLEVVLNGSRTANDLAKLPTAGIFQDLQTGQRYLTLVYRISKNTEGIDVSPQASDELQNWSAVIPVPTGFEDSSVIEMKAQIPMSGVSKKFLRLSVSR